MPAPSVMPTLSKSQYVPHSFFFLTPQQWGDFVKTLDGRNILLVPFCCTKDCEENIKNRSAEEAKQMAAQGDATLTSAAKSLCIPFAQPEGVASHKCIGGCGADAAAWTLFGRSY
jgi:prolyl-tRNA synthetase